MDQINELNLQSKKEMTQLSTFLQRFNLQIDVIDYGVILEDNGKIIGSCCKQKNICKCFAVDPAYQGEGITNRLLTFVANRIFEEGYRHSFIFTKPANALIFKSLGYSEILSTDTVTLLEKGLTTIEQHIGNIKNKNNVIGANNGTIVVNGNPFTLGHQYLVETAAAKCDQLLVFVVEEDASSFPFKDRFALIQQGTKHLSNVIVLPSSHYIISQATFPNYFLRDKDNGFAAYAKLDVSIFGQYFAKQLNIKTRFVGEEPLDEMTRQYNETMQSILPYYGVKLDILKRKENEISVISASKVRALLKEDKWDEVAKYVPKTTLDYLKNATTVIAEIKKYDRQH